MISLGFLPTKVFFSRTDKSCNWKKKMVTWCYCRPSSLGFVRGWFHHSNLWPSCYMATTSTRSRLFFKSWKRIHPKSNKRNKIYINKHKKMNNATCSLLTLIHIKHYFIFIIWLQLISLLFTCTLILLNATYD